MTKPNYSQLIRDYLVTARKQNQTPQQVTQWAIDHLGLDRSIAPRLVAQNWDRPQYPKRGTCKQTADASTVGFRPPLVSKSSKTRELICVALLNNYSNEWLVERVAQETGYKKSVARRYIKINWDRALEDFNSTLRKHAA